MTKASSIRRQRDWRVTRRLRALNFRDRVRQRSGGIVTTGKSAVNPSPEVVVRACIDRLNRGDLAAAAGLIAPDAINHAADDAVGPQAFIAGWQELRTAFPDWQFEIVDAVEAGDRVHCRYRNCGTQQAAFAGHPATGRTFEALGLDCVRVVDGLVVEHWALLDLTDMGRQLGWEDD